MANNQDANEAAEVNIIPPLNLLVITRGTGDDENCLTNGVNTVLQMPNVITSMSCLAQYATSNNANQTFVEMTSGSMTALEDAMDFLVGVSIVEQVGNGDGADASSYEVITRLSNGIPNVLGELTLGALLSMDIVVSPGADEQAHYEPIVKKRGLFYLIPTVKDSKVACLGDTASAGRMLSTDVGRERIRIFLQQQYPAEEVEVRLGGNWGGLEHADPKPLLIVSRFTVPYGEDRSLFDMFYDPDEVVRWLKGRSINARLDNKMTKDVQKNGGIAVQVLDLGNEAAHRRYVVDLSWTG